MVERTSQELQLSASQAVQQQQSGAGFLSPDFNKYTQTIDMPAGQGESSSDRLVQTLLGVGSKIADTAIAVSREEAYLDGVAKAGTIQNEDELQSSPLTRNWQKAGYRDTMGKLAAADNEAQIASDMHTMREKSPEEFAAYMAQKRADLMRSWEGMSLDSRKTLFAKQMLDERAAIKKHGAEHYKYVVDTEQKAVQSSMTAAMADLNAAKDNETVYAAKAVAVFGTMNHAVLNNSKLPKEIRSKMLADFAGYALESDNHALYQMMQNDEITRPDGTKGTAMSLVSWEDQVKVSKEYRESMKRTEGMRSTKYMDDQAFMEANWANPSTPLQSVEEVRAFRDEGIRKGYMNADQGKAFMMKYYEKSAKKLESNDLANAYISGDQQHLLSKNKTSDEALDAWEDQVGRKLSMPQYVAALAKIGNMTGQENAFKRIGQRMAPAFAQLGANDKIDPNNAAAIKSTFDILDASVKAGREGAFSQFMSGFSPEIQTKVAYIREGIRGNLDPVSAINRANDRIAKDATMTKEERQAVLNSNAAENTAAVAEVTERGLFGTAWLKAKSMFSPDAANTLAITTRRKWFEDPTRTEEALAGSRMAYAEELSAITQSGRNMTAESRKTIALAAVANRTVITESGPLVVPRGQTVQQYFGVDANVDGERISKALSEYLPPKPDTRMVYSNHNGMLMFTEFGEKGQMVRSGTVDPKGVKSIVQKQREAEALQFGLEHGEGTTKVNKVDGVEMKVSYNGDNSANVGNDWMFRFRGKLVEHEGIRDKAYRDLSGRLDAKGNPIMVAGVGVASTNTHYPKPDANGVITKEAIDKSFRMASNEAAFAAQRLMTTTRKMTEPAFQLYAELAYQSGPGFANKPEYKPMMQAIVNNDYPAAQAALEASPAWKWTKEGSARRNHYRQVLKDAMKG